MLEVIVMYYSYGYYLRVTGAPDCMDTWVKFCRLADSSGYAANPDLFDSVVRSIFSYGMRFCNFYMLDRGVI